LAQEVVKVPISNLSFQLDLHWLTSECNLLLFLTMNTDV